EVLIGDEARGDIRAHPLVARDDHQTGEFAVVERGRVLGRLLEVRAGRTPCEWGRFGGGGRGGRGGVGFRAWRLVRAAWSARAARGAKESCGHRESRRQVVAHRGFLHDEEWFTGSSEFFVGRGKHAG